MASQSQIIPALQYSLRILITGILSITAIGNICEAFLITSFFKTYRDLLHGSPLPAATDFVVHFRFLLIILAFIWPAIGLVALYTKNQIRVYPILFSLAQGAILFQYGFTILALMMPVWFPINEGIQDASNSR